MLKIKMLRSKRSAKLKELTQLRSKRTAQQKREEELDAALEAADEVSPDLEQQVNDLAQEQQNVDDAIAAATAAIAELDAAIEAEESAAADALETAIQTDPEEVDDPGEYVAGIRPGARRSTAAGRQQRAAQFQRTGRQQIRNVPQFIRSPLLSTDATLAKPIGVDGINDGVGFGVVSSIIDMVTVEDCTGMGTHRVAYDNVDAAEAAAYSPRGTVPTELASGFNFIDLAPSDYACISYIDKGIRKVTPLLYEEKVRAKARTALRKRLSKIVVDSILASSLNVAQSVTATTIGPSFLSDLILSYGGDEEIEGDAVLFLSKADLKAFAAVRGKNEYLPVYSIVPSEGNPNTGIIKDNYGLSCRYCLNRNVTALSSATRGAAAIKTMFYGNPKAAELDIWGELDVEVSEGYKFAEGLLTVRGEVTADADVVMKNGFVVVTLAANA